MPAWSSPRQLRRRTFGLWRIRCSLRRSPAGVRGTVTVPRCTVPRGAVLPLSGLMAAAVGKKFINKSEDVVEEMVQVRGVCVCTPRAWLEDGVFSRRCLRREWARAGRSEGVTGRATGACARANANAHVHAYLHPPGRALSLARATSAASAGTRSTCSRGPTTPASARSRSC